MPSFVDGTTVVITKGSAVGKSEEPETFTVIPPGGFPWPEDNSCGINAAAPQEAPGGRAFSNLTDHFGMPPLPRPAIAFGVPTAHGGPPRGGSAVAAKAAGTERAHARKKNRDASKRGMNRASKKAQEPGRGRGAGEPAARPGPTEAPPIIVEALEVWPIERLMPLDRNPRTHSDAQIDEIAASIQRFGFLVPVIVDEEGGRILAGNGRYAAAVRLRMTKVPVIPASHLTPAQQQAFIIADNELALHAGWDNEILAEYFMAIEAAGVPATSSGFDAESIAEILALVGAEERPQEDRVPPVPKRATSVRGDLWAMGSHRLYCGDSTDMKAIEAVMEGAPADVVWTDPPYGVDYSTNAGSVTNDDLPEREFAALILSALKNCNTALKAGGAIYVSHADTAGLTFRRCFLEAGFRLSSVIIWCKDSLVLSRGDYHWQHEPILYGWKPGAGHRWFGPRNQTTIAKFESPPFQQIGDDEWQIQVGDTMLVVRGKDVMVQALRSTVMHHPRPRSSAEHPTMKPVALIERMINNSARPGFHMLDPFAGAGAGSSLIACEGRGLTAHLVEIEPRYVDVIIQRWQSMTERQATLATSGDPKRGHRLHHGTAFTFDRVAELRADDPR